MAYAIARLKKLKRSNLTGSAAHTARERETPNADPTKQNIRFIGSLTPEEKLEDLVLAKIAEHEQKRKIRTDGVYCVEMLLSASPSYFRPENPSQAGYYEPEKLDDWLEATHQWLADEYGDRIVRAELHLDETTPHVHAYFVPLDDEGQLRCSHFFDGREKIQQFQDSYYQTMRLIGLERGLKGSRAQHQDIKDFYRIVQEGRDIEADDLNPEQLKAKAADRDRATRSKEEMESTAKALAKENELLRKRIAELEQQTQQLRDLPLENIAWELGLNYDHGSWKGFTHIINIDGSKFYDFSPNQALGAGGEVQQGEKELSFNKALSSPASPASSASPALFKGGGAIDLVMHVNSCSFREAIAWLSDQFGEAGAERAAIAHAVNATSEIVQSEPRPQFRLPVEDKAKWTAVSDYLTQKRLIGENLVQALHERGLIYADDQQNAVFVMRNLGDLPHAKGAFLRGTRGENNSFKGYEKGTKRREGWFYFHLGGQPTDPPEKLVLCSSPIDAMSIAMLEYQVRGNVPLTRTLYMAVDSPKSLPVEQLQHIPNVQVAFDPNESGNAAARAVKELLPQATRLKCKAVDWNEELIKHRYSPQLQEGFEL